MGVILLVAFLVLGPTTFIDVVRTAGTTIRDLRRAFNDIVAAVDLEKEEKPEASGTNLPPAASEEQPPSRDQT